MGSKIPFNRPFVAGKELFYIAQAITYDNLGGDGHFTNACARLLEDRFKIPKVLLVPSCTAALEMAAILFDLKPGDEVLLPSFTFVSTASCLVRLGVRPVFIDIRPDTLNIDENLLEQAITSRTRAIFPVHYAGVGCDMARIMKIAERFGLRVAEDAAQAVNSYHNGQALGSIGHLGCYSFHETKNVICGEGGALCINDPALIERAEIIRDKGTNRKQFFRGQVDKYTWVDNGSSYVPSELSMAFLYGQLELVDVINSRRLAIYRYYRNALRPLAEEGLLKLPASCDKEETNSHLFYILLKDHDTRNALMDHLNSQGINAVFHYVPLHNSPMGIVHGHTPRDLPVTEEISGRLLRLPLYYDITQSDQMRVVEQISLFLKRTDSRG